MHTGLVRGACVMLAVILLTACSLGADRAPVGAQSGSEPSQVTRRPDNLPPEESADNGDEGIEDVLPGEAPDDEPAVPRDAGEVILYLYRPEEKNYFPSTEPMGKDNSAGAILDMVMHVLGFPAGFDAVIQQEAGPHLIISLDGGFIDTCLNDEETESVFLNTLCATIAENRPDVQTIELQRDGAVYQSNNRTLGPGPYLWPELVIGGGTAAEYAAMRAQFGYDGMSDYKVDFLRYDIVPTDETGRALTRYLARIGDPGREIDGPEALGAEYRLACALENVVWYTTQNYGQPETYHPELRPIATAVNNDTVAMAEHVEQVVRDLFGEVPFQHAELQPWQWHPIEGVYTPPRVSAAQVQPVILQYTEKGDEYIAEVVYLQYVGSYVDEQGATIPESELPSAVQSRLSRREVTVARAGEDGFVFQSHRYL